MSLIAALVSAGRHGHLAGAGRDLQLDRGGDLVERGGAVLVGGICSARALGVQVSQGANEPVRGRGLRAALARRAAVGVGAGRSAGCAAAGSKAGEERWTWPW